MRRAMRGTGCALLVLLAAAACDGAKREASAVVGAIDRYRDAENAQKPERADALDQVPCTDAEVCAAKNACTKAADATAKGLRLQREVAKGLDALKAEKHTPDSPAGADLATKLQQSTDLLADGDAAMPECDRQVTALRIKYSL